MWLNELRRIVLGVALIEIPLSIDKFLVFPLKKRFFNRNVWFFLFLSANREKFAFFLVFLLFPPFFFPILCFVISRQQISFGALPLTFRVIFFNFFEFPPPRSKGYNWVLVMIEKLFCWHAQSFWFLKQPGINITLPIRIGLRQGASVIE